MSRRADDGPTYNGRTLREWLALHRNKGSQKDKRKEAVLAVRQIGTNGLPYLLKSIQYEPSRRQHRLETVKRNLPRFLQKYFSRPASDESAFERLQDSLVGFQILESQATASIPELDRLMGDTNRSPHVRLNAGIAMAYAGTEGPLRLIQIVTNAPPINQGFALVSISMLQNHDPARLGQFLPTLIRCLQDPTIGPTAVTVLGQMKGDLDVVLPALTNAFSSSYSDVRYGAVSAFNDRQENHAAFAAPALRGLVNDPDRNVALAASNILQALPTTTVTPIPPK
jgi:hypothetical protein